MGRMHYVFRLSVRWCVRTIVRTTCRGGAFSARLDADFYLSLSVFPIMNHIPEVQASLVVCYNVFWTRRIYASPSVVLLIHRIDRSHVVYTHYAHWRISCSEMLFAFTCWWSVSVTYTARILCGGGLWNCRASVRLSVCPIIRRVCCCGPGGQEISIDCCTAGAQQQMRAVSRCQLT